LPGVILWITAILPEGISTWFDFFGKKG